VSKVSRLEEVPDELFDDVTKAQRGLLSEMISLLGRLDVSGGALVLSNENLAIVGEISESMQALAEEGEYIDGVTKFIDEFRIQGDVNNEYFKGLVGSRFENKEIYDVIIRQSQADATALLGEGAIRKEFTEPLKQILTSGVSSEMKFVDLVENLNAFIIGNDKVDGKLLRYSKQVARDAFSVADRRYTKIVADELGIDKFRYSGGTVTDSRDFCVQRVGKTFSKKEVESWGNIPNWQGRIPGTNSSNIFELAGGFNCLHSILPV